MKPLKFNQVETGSISAMQVVGLSRNISNSTNPSINIWRFSYIFFFCFFCTNELNYFFSFYFYTPELNSPDFNKYLTIYFNSISSTVTSYSAFIFIQLMRFSFWQCTMKNETKYEYVRRRTLFLWWWYSWWVSCYMSHVCTPS